MFVASATVGVAAALGHELILNSSDAFKFKDGVEVEVESLAGPGNNPACTAI